MTGRSTTGRRLEHLERQAADRDAELVERTAELMAGVLRGVLADLDLTAEQRHIAAEAVPRHLRRTRESLAGRTT